jgi:hypothetical protein
MAADTAGVGRTTEAQVPAPAKDYRREFYLAEFKALRKEVEIRLAEINQIEYQVFLGAAATYAWLLTRPTDTSALSKVGWAVPLFLALYGYFKIKHSIGVLRKLGQYIGIVRDERGEEQPRDKKRAQQVSREDKANDPPGEKR